jgi:hypothetical protein
VGFPVWLDAKAYSFTIFYEIETARVIEEFECPAPD